VSSEPTNAPAKSKRTRPSLGLATARALVSLGIGLWEWRLRDDSLRGDAAFFRLAQLSRRGRPHEANALFARVHPQDVDLLSAAVAEAIRSVGSFDVVLRLRRDRQEKGGPEFVTRRLRGHAVGRGAVTHLAGIITDPQASGSGALRRPSDAIEGIAVGVAHEFNNVLQIVTGYVEFARRSLPNESESRSDLDHALAAADRATQLTRRLGEFARASDTDGEPTDLVDVISEFDLLLRPILGDAIRYRCAVASERLLASGADASLRQAILNLCVNARDAMSRGGELMLRAERIVSPGGGLVLADGQSLPTGDYARVWVTDSGEGISPERISRMWDPFYTTKRGSHGSGLGLSIVRSTLHRLGGTATVYSVEGVGTSFALYIPVAPSAVHAAERKHSQEFTAIVVGDLLARAARGLRQQGWRLLTCQDLESATALAADPAHQRAIVVVDAAALRNASLPASWARSSGDRGPFVVAVTGFDPESGPAVETNERASAVVAYPLLPAHLAAIATHRFRRSTVVNRERPVELGIATLSNEEQLLIDAGLLRGPSEKHSVGF
jgi:signal transduction histidine kinase